MYKIVSDSECVCSYVAAFARLRRVRVVEEVGKHALRACFPTSSTGQAPQARACAPAEKQTHTYGYSARAATSSRQKAGMSSTTRPHTRLPSRKAGSLTQMPPALVISSLIPVEPVALCPRI